ncbi:MAG: oligosaccharide flippase family protein [Lachnospiraceae bacterium]|nr:oligosaccharide flippase family protein [Lachnospiraceae bacterium]
MSVPKNRNKKNRTGTFEINSVVVFILAMIANILGAVFQLLASHILADEALFAELNSIMALFNILVLPTTVASCLTAKYTAELHAHKEDGKVKGLLHNLVKVLGILTIIFGLLMIALHGVIGSWLHIKEETVVLLAVILADVTMLSAVFTGGLQGTKQFVLYGIFGLIGPVFKIAAVMLSRLFANKIVGLLLIWLIGTLVSYLIGSFFLRRVMGTNTKESPGLDRTEVVRYIMKLIAANAGIILLSNLDMLLVKHFFDREAGLYSAARVLAYCITYLTNTLVIVLFPMAADSLHTEKENLKLLRKCIIYNVLLSVAAIIVIFIFADIGIRILLGKTYLDCKQYLLPIMILVLPISLLTLLANYGMARGKTRFITSTLLIGVIAAVGGGLCIRNSLFLLIGYLSVVFWVTVIVNIVMLFGIGRSNHETQQV